MASPKREINLEHEKWLDEIVDYKEAARLRGISIETLRSEIDRGALRAIQISKKRKGMSRREALMRESRS